MKHFKYLIILLLVIILPIKIGATNHEVGYAVYKKGNNIDFSYYYGRNNELKSVKINNIELNEIVIENNIATGDYEIVDNESVSIKYNYLDELDEGEYNVEVALKNDTYTITLFVYESSSYYNCQSMSNSYWCYKSSNGTLYINGYGEVDYNKDMSSAYGSYYIWEMEGYNIHKVVVSDNITSLDGGFLSNNTYLNLTEVILPNTLTKIGDRLFFNQNSLTTITIPDSVTSIGLGAFYNCTNLSEETIDKINSINSLAFKKKYPGYDNMYILNSDSNAVVSINSEDFDKFTGLKINNVVLEKHTNENDGDYIVNSKNKKVEIKTSYLDSLTEGTYNVEVLFEDGFSNSKLYVYDCSNNSCNKCGDKAFWSYDAKTKTLTIKGIGPTYDYNQPDSEGANPWINLDIDKVVVKEGITGLGKYFFSNLSMKSVELPNTLSSIDVMAFYGCEKLEGIIIPDSVTSMSNYIFEYNYSLKSVKLSNNLSELGYGVFQGCESLEEIDIPESLNNLGYGNFYNTRKLKKVYLHGSAPSTTYDSAPFPENKKEFRIYVPYGASGYDTEKWEKYYIYRYDGVNKKQDYNVVVNGGYGNFDYNEGDIVNISPNVPHGKQFSYWKVDSGNVVLNNTNEPNQSFTMPKGNVEITANYVNAYSDGEDNTPPMVTDLRISKNEVFKPGIIDVEIDVVEEDSGITSLSLYYSNEKYSNSSLYVDGINKKVFSGTIKTQIRVSSLTKNGKYVLSGLSVSDGKGNSTYYGVRKEGDNYYLTNDYNATNPSNPLYKKIDSAVFEVKDSYNISLDTTLSNPNLANRIASLKDNESARIVIDDNTIVKKEVFDAIKGTNKKIILYKDEYEWIFDGKDIINETKDINLKTTISSVSGSSFFTDKNIVSLVFKSNGLLPGKARVRIKSDYLYNLKGITGNLYLYYDLGDELEQVGEDLDLILDGSDKWVSFDITHNSKYYVSGKKIHKKPTVRKSTVTGLGNKTYTGSSIKPKVTVKLNNKTLKLNTNYTVTYSNNKNVGLGKVVIKGKGSYIGSITKTFKIIPKGTSLTKLVAGKSLFTVKWKKQATQTSGYEIQYSRDKSFKNDVISIVVNKNKTVSKKINKLESKKKYFVRIRTYKTVKGVKYYSSWSKVNSITTK